MIKVVSRIAGAGLIAALLTACGSEQGANASLSQLALGSVSQAVKARRADPAQKIVLSAEQLAQINVPVVQINPESLGGSDFLQRVTSRRDSGLGVVEVWKSSDNAQVFLRNGVVVGSRGIGGDIISADANVTIRALSAGAESNGIRTYVISDGDVTTTEYKFRCTVESVGDQNLTLFNQGFRLHQMRESCIGGPGGDKVLRNDYWVQRSDGFVRKSRQWMGPRIGYFEVIVVKR